MLPRIVRSPVDSCFGTSPSQAPKSRPFENASPAPIEATIALEITGPMPQTIRRTAPVKALSRCQDAVLVASWSLVVVAVCVAHITFIREDAHAIFIRHWCCADCFHRDRRV